MTYLFLLLIILTFFLVGYVILSAFLSKKQANTQLVIGGGYGISLIIVISQMFLYSVFHLSITKITVVIPWIFLIAGSFILIRIRKIIFPKLRLPNGKGNRFGVLLLASLVVFAGVEGLLRLPMGWDAIATWFLMGKAFYYAGGLTTSIYHYAQIDNPPGLGLVLAFFYTLFGRVDDHAALLFFSSIYLALLLVLYGSIKSFTNTKTAIFFSLFFATLQPAIRQAGRFEAGYADLLLAYFFISSTSLLMEYSKTKRSYALLLATLVAGASSFIKNEGAAFFLVFLLISGVTQLRIRQKNLLSLLPGIVYFLSWQGFKYAYPLNPSYYENSRVVLDRIGLVSKQMLIEFLNLERWNFLWVTFFATFLFFPKKLIGFIPFQLFVLQLLIYFSIYMISPLDPADHIVGSFDRLLLQIASLALLSIAFCAYAILKKSLLFETPHKN